MKNKVFTVTLFLLIISAASVAAQNLPGGIWSSPQSTTTEGRFRSNADDFIRPDAYTNVRFDKWFGMTAFLWEPENYTAVATAGFATKANNIYIGAFYNGNLWAYKTVNNYTERVYDTTPPAGGITGKTYNVYNSINLGGVNTPLNNAAVLIGVANMGFRLTYRTNYQSFNENSIVTGDQLYNNYQMELGYMIPQIAWAMTKNLTANGIKPYLTVDLAFDRNYQKFETAGPDENNITGTKIGRSLNHFDPVFSVGLGGYTLYRKEAFSLSADLDYVLTLNIYDNDYSYIDNGVYKTGNIKGTFSPGINPYIERSFISHLVTPSLSGSWSQDKLSLRFKLNLPLTFSGEDQNSMTMNSASNLIYHGISNSYSTFIFRPDLRLAMRYSIVPNTLALNAGARIQATAITIETRNQKTYNEGENVDTRTVHQDGFGSGFVSRFSLGTTVNLTENFWVEAVTGVSNAYGNSGTIDIFAPGGLFSFGSILVALKF